MELEVHAACRQQDHKPGEGPSGPVSIADDPVEQIAGELAKGAQSLAPAALFGQQHAAGFFIVAEPPVVGRELFVGLGLIVVAVVGFCVG